MVMDSARLPPFRDATFVAALHAALALKGMPLRLHEPRSKLFELRVVMGRVAAMSSPLKGTLILTTPRVGKP